MKLAAYIRVSTSRQANENDSLDGQKIAIMRWAKQNDHQIVKYYIEEGKSAFRGNRPTMDQMLADIELGKVNFEGVVVYSLSRFARQEKNRHIFDEVITNSGLSFHSITEHLPDDPDTAHLMKSLLGSVNEHQSRQNARVVSDRKADAVEKGFFTGGRAPYGYMSVPAPDAIKGKKILVIQKDQAAAVKEIFRLALEGTHGQPFGVKRIGQHLNEKGVKPNSSHWTTNSVHRILTDPIYIGLREYRPDFRKKHKDIAPIFYRNPKILDEDTFYSVQKGLKSRAPEQREVKAQRSKSLLTGLVKCSECQSNFVVITGKSGQYEYYRCNRKIKVDAKSCNCPNIPKPLIEKSVVEAVAERVLSEDCLSEYVLTLKAKHKAAVKVDKQHLLSLQVSSAATEKQYKTLLELLSTEQLTLDQTTRETLEGFKRKLEQIKSEERSLKEKIALPIKKFGQRHISLFAEAAINVIAKGDREATKALLTSVIKEITVYPKKMTIKGGVLPLAVGISRVNTKKGTQDGVPLFISKWRRGRDSNPRYRIRVYSLSRGAPSATRPPLHQNWASASEGHE